MSGAQSEESKRALEANRSLAQGYYGIALPGLQDRAASIESSLAQGQPQYLKDAYAGQRTGLQEGLAARGGVAKAQQMQGSKKALSGGNPFASLNPADVGAQLANALYGSKFAEGQAGLQQNFNLMGMALGGSGQAGNAALTASGNQLQAIGFMPRYDPTYANIVGGAAGAAGVYGAINQAWPQAFGPAGTTNTGQILPPGWSSASFAP